MKTSRRAALPRPSTRLKTQGAAATPSGAASSAAANPGASDTGAQTGNTGGSGVALGLALTRTGATVATVECLPLPGRGKIILTGNLVGSARDAAHVAVSLARARAKKLGLDPTLFLNLDLHFHVMDPLPPKGGPSIGLPMFVALVSALTRSPVNPTFAFTGELSLTGAVLPVEGIAEKAKAAVRAGAMRLYAPAGNKGELKRVPKSLTIDVIDSVDALNDSLNIKRWKTAPSPIHLKGKGPSTSEILISERRAG